MKVLLWAILVALLFAGCCIGNVARELRRLDNDTKALILRIDALRAERKGAKP